MRQSVNYYLINSGAGSLFGREDYYPEVLVLYLERPVR
jgi:hypothetical protein